MKQLGCTLLILLLLQTAHAQKHFDKTSVFVNGMARAEQDTHSFYIDTAGNRIFDTLIPFHNEDFFLAITQQQKQGVLNAAMHWVLQPVYDSIDTHLDIWKIAQNGKQTWCDTSGNLLAPLRFADIGYLDGNRFDVQQNGKWGIYDRSQDSMIVPFSYDLFDYCGGCQGTVPYVLAQKNGKWGVIDFKGNALTPFAYGHVHLNMRSDEWMTSFQKNDNWVVINLLTQKEYGAPTFSDGSILDNGLLCIRRNNKYELINNRDQVVLDFQYDYIQDIHINQAFPSRLVGIRQHGHYGIADTSGNIILKPVYDDQLWSYGDTLFDAVKGKKHTLINTAGKQLLPQYYDDITIVSPQPQDNSTTTTPTLFSIKLNGKYALYNAGSKRLSAFIYSDISAPEGQLFTVKANGKTGCLNTNGQEILPTLFEDISFPDQYNLIRAKKNKLEGLYTTSGRMLLPPKYDFIFANEYTDSALLLLKIYKADKTLMGIADTTGKLLIPVTYHFISQLSDHYFLLMRDNHYFLTDIANGKTDPLPYEEVSPTACSFLLLVKKQDKLRLLNFITGQLLPGQYSFINTFHNGLAIMETNDKYGMIDSLGRQVVPPVYDRISAFIKGIAQVTRNKYKYGFIDSTGKEIIPAGYDALAYGDEEDYRINNLLALYKEDPDDNNHMLTGLAATDGTILQQPVFKKIWAETTGQGLLVQQNTGWGVLSADGQRMIVPPMYENIELSEQNRYTNKITFTWPLACYKDKKWQYVEPDGRILPVESSEIISFKNFSIF